MKKIVFSIVAISLLLFSCASTSATAEKPEIKETDGTFLISNRDSSGKPFLTGDIYIATKLPDNYFGDIDFIAFGTLPDDKTKSILKTSIQVPPSGQKDFVKCKPEISLSDFDKVMLATLSGKITKAKVQVKDGSLYVTISGYDFHSLSSVVKQTTDKMNAQKEAKAKAEAEKHKKFIESLTENGKKLYEQKISSQDKDIPILIKSYNLTKDSLDGIDVFIDFQNVSGKRIKYVYFEVTPYNTVNDIAYSTLDRSSTKSLEATGFFAADTPYSYHWKAQWYNPTINYIKINSAKVVFDDSTVVFPKANIDKLFTAKTITHTSKMENGEMLKIKYSLADNSVKLSYGYTTKKANYNNYALLCHFDIDTDTTSEKEAKSYEKSWFGYYNENDKIFLESELQAYSLAAVKSGYIEHTETKFKHTFTEAELQFIRDCACIRYYIGNKE